MIDIECNSDFNTTDEGNLIAFIRLVAAVMINYRFNIEDLYLYSNLL